MQSSNKMESMQISKLLISIAIPLMFPRLVQSLYSIVDSNVGSADSYDTEE